MLTLTDEIMRLLSERIGLDTHSIGRPAVDYALRLRMNALHIERPDQYREYLRSSAGELQQLIETVIVPETWFFRHTETFDEMVRFVMTEWEASHGGESLKVLSLPCSTGEEPYSVVMALCEAGFPLRRLRVDAMDISRRSLEHAAQAVYRPYSFRNKDVRFRDKYFSPEGGRYRLHDALRQPVHFHMANALELQAMAGAGAYDIILCRNLLIYLERDAQEKVVSNLAYCLQNGGRLFSSPAEHGFFSGNGFRSLGVPGASVFRKSQDSPPARLPRAVTGVAEQPARFAPRTGTARSAKNRPAAPRNPLPKPADASPAPSSSPSGPGTAADALARVAALADAGRLQEAHDLCVRHMSEQGESSQGLYLLGLISDARHSAAEAEQLYRKALYLDPLHVDALLHLAWLRDHAGDTAQARQLRERARRAQQRRAQSRRANGGES